MGSSATTYGPCSITICKRAGQITLKSEQLHTPYADMGPESKIGFQWPKFFIR